jgi:predicted glycoside hydrolase/deacetylase ChbG (UPF0249 family)
MKVIINADDFGYSDEMNSAIEKAIISHRISSTTIMANAPMFEEATRIAKNYPNISYGVHLNIIEFKPLSDTRIFKKYKLVDDNDEFIMGAVFTLREFPYDLKVAIKEEWRAQIERVVETGINISHLDSHQHTHAIYALEGVVTELLEEYHIHRIRRKFYVSVSRMLRERGYERPIYNGVSERVNTDNHKLLSKLWRHFVSIPYNQRRWVNKMRKHAVMTDDIYIYQVFVQELQHSAYRYRNRIIEAECHPGLSANQNETEWLMQDKLREYSKDYQLISYNDL